MREVFIVAGEASGDLHGSGLVARLRELVPEVRVTGFGGERMEAAGVELLARTTGIIGFVEVLRHLPEQLGLLRRATDRFRSGDVGLAILIDYGGFNLRAAAAARAAGVPVLYYITPQVWASRPGRMRTMARVITKAAVILPFEEELLRANGVDATFVGHPLLDRVAHLKSSQDARERLGLSVNDRVLALFPGSRRQEITRHLADFAAVARELERRRPGLRVVVSVAPTVDIPVRELPYQLVRSASFDILRAADVALCKSGTTTLEAAIAGCPSAIVYRINPLTYAFLKHIVRVPHIGLVNIVAGHRLVPEFVQDAFRPLEVADTLDGLFDPDAPARTTMVAGLAAVRSRLGTPGAAGRVAAMAAAMLR